MNKTETENKATPAEVAHSLESSTFVQREEIWGELTAQEQGEVLPFGSFQGSCSNF